MTLPRYCHWSSAENPAGGITSPDCRASDARRCPIVVAVVLALAALTGPVCASGWIGTISAVDAEGKAIDLEFGFHSQATDGIDVELGEVEQPPPPPRNILYAVWHHPRLGNGALRDLRPIPAYGDSLVFQLTIQRTGPVSLHWDPDQLSRGLHTAVLTDGFGGTLFSANLLEQEEATIENKQISELRLACVARKIEVTTAVHTTGAASGPRRYAEYDRVEMVVYPNPFNSHAVININLPDEESIDIEIYNTAGHRIHQLASIRPIAGNYSVVWNGRDRQYMPVASGMYWIHVRSAGKRLTQSLVLLR